MARLEQATTARASGADARVGPHGLPIIFVIKQTSHADGVSQWALHTVPRLRQAGMDAHIAVLSCRGSFKADQPWIHYLSKEGRGGLLGALLQLAVLCRSLRGCMLHINCHYSSSLIALLGLLVGAKRRIVHSRGETLAEDARRSAIARLGIQFAKAAILLLATDRWAVSDKAGEFFFNLGRLKWPFKIIRSGIDLTFDSLKTHELGPVKIVNIGRLHYQKNQAFLIKAFACFRAVYSSARLVLIGGGPDKDRLISLSRELGVDDAVDFVGEIRSAFGFLLSSDITVACFPSRYEGLPRAAVETQAAGIYTYLSHEISKETALSTELCGFFDLADGPEALGARWLAEAGRWRRAKDVGRRAFEESELYLPRAVDSLIAALA